MIECGVMTDYCGGRLALSVLLRLGLVYMWRMLVDGTRGVGDAFGDIWIDLCLLFSLI